MPFMLINVETLYAIMQNFDASARLGWLGLEFCSDKSLHDTGYLRGSIS